MSTKKIIDPEIAPIVDLLPSISLSDASLGSVRSTMSRYDPEFDPAFIPEIRHIGASNGSPEIPIHLYNVDPGKSGRPLVLHIHGGGMVFGSARMAAQSLPRTLTALDAVGISVEYRLAPETPFPGPQEDCYDALRWAVENATELGVDVGRIIVTGDSAGGGLAAALAIMARDRGEFALAGQALIYPMLDHRTGGPDAIWKNPFAGEFIWTPESNAYGWRSLQGDYMLDDHRKAYFSPSLLEDPSGLPATLILTGGLDLFVDENLDFARRLTSAGVATELHLYPRVVHGFNAIADAAISKTAARDFTEGVRRILASQRQ